MNAIAVLASALVVALYTPCASAERFQPDYQALRNRLRTSSVPVLLPFSIPAAIEPVRSVVVIDAGRDGYYVGFSPIAQCSGALSCAFFHVAGSPATSLTRQRAAAGIALRLPDGVRATYQAEDCSGSSCVEAALRFERGSASYELDVKSGRDDRAILIRAYRSLRQVFATHCRRPNARTS